MRSFSAFMAHRILINFIYSNIANLYSTDTIMAFRSHPKDNDDDEH